MEVVGSMPSENREVFQQLTRTALELTQARSDAFFSQHGGSLITEAYHDSLPQSDAAKMLEELTQMEKETTADMQTDFGRIQNRRRLEEVKRKRYEFEAYMKHQEKVKALKEGIRQRVHVDHGDEVVQGDYAMTTSANGTIGMDTVEEHVDLGINELGVAAIAVRVTAVRILPFEPESNKWRKSSVSVTRTIEIDLLCCEDTRLLYAKLQRAHALASREQHDGEGGGRRGSPAVANMDAADTYRVFAALMNITSDGSRSGEVGGGGDNNVGFDSRSGSGGAERPHGDEAIGGDLMLLGSQARKFYLGGGGVAATAASKSDTGAVDNSGSGGRFAAAGRRSEQPSGDSISVTAYSVASAAKSDSGAVDSSRSDGRFAAAGRRSEQPSGDSVSITATSVASAPRSLQSAAPAVKRMDVHEASMIDAEKRVTSERPVGGGSRNVETPEWRRRARAARQESVAAAAAAAAAATDDSSASAEGSLSPNMMSVHRSQATGIDSTDYSSAAAAPMHQQPPTRTATVGQVSASSLSRDRVTIPKSTAANLASGKRETVPALSPLSLRHGTYFRAAADDDAAFMSAATMVPVGERAGDGADDYTSHGHDASQYKSLGDRSDVRSVGGGDAGSLPIKSAGYARGQPAAVSAAVIDFSDEEESSSLRRSSYTVAETQQLQRIRRADADDASGSQRAYNSSAKSDAGQDSRRLNSSSSSAAQPLQGATTAALGTADRFATADSAAAGGPIGAHAHASSSSSLSLSLSGVSGTPRDAEHSAIGRLEIAPPRNATSFDGGDADPSLKSTQSATSFHTPDGAPTRQRHSRQSWRTARDSDDKDGSRGGGAAGSSYSTDRGVRSSKESRADAKSAESALVDGGSGGSSYITSQRQSLFATSRVSSVSSGSVGGVGGSGDAGGDWRGGSDSSERRTYQMSGVNGDGGLNSSAASATAAARRLSSAMAGIPHAEASTRAEDYERVRRRHLDVLSDMRRLRIAPLAVEPRGGSTEVSGNSDVLVTQTGSLVMRNDY